MSRLPFASSGWASRAARSGAQAGRPTWRWATVLGLSAGLAACVAPPALPPPPAPAAPVAPPAEQAPPPPIGGQVVARGERLALYRVAPEESLASVAQKLLGSPAQAWQIEQANGTDRVEPGQLLIIPLRPLNPGGVEVDRIQTIPVLCYHRFGSGHSKMVVSPERFASQLEWLARNDYRVIRLSDLQAFLGGRQPLPPRSVVITVDDGYESFHRHALPLLRRYGFPATVFVYTDFLGAGDALRWSQLQEMLGSGLVDVQSHSKSHRNLVERLPGETEERYRSSLDAELALPRSQLNRRLNGADVRYIAYPFGDANPTVTAAAQREGFELGLTVVPGGNPFYAQPMLLRRTMIFGDLDLEGFKARLQTAQPFPAP